MNGPTTAPTTTSTQYDGVVGSPTRGGCNAACHANDAVASILHEYAGLQSIRKPEATNLKTSLDNALERRLSFKINFPFPDAAQRETIWRR